MWNSAGFRASATSTPAKFGFLDSQFPNGGFNIAAILETHHKDEQDYSEELGHFCKTHNIFHSPVRNETHSGVIVLISKDFEIIRHSEPLPGRLMNFLVKKTGKTLNFSVFYGHQWAKMNNEDIITVLKEFDNRQDPADKHVIMGDFNFEEVDIDKGKGMSAKDRMIKPHWDRITTEH